MAMLRSMTRPKTRATRRKAKLPAKAPTKMVTGKQQKRKPQSRVSPPLVKRQMTEANSQKKGENEVEPIDKQHNDLSDVVIISSDEEEEEAPLLPDIDPGIHKDVNPPGANVERIPGDGEGIPERMLLKITTKAETKGVSNSLPESNSDSPPTQDNPLNALATVQSEHAQEIQRLLQELDAANAENKRIQQLQDTAAKYRELEHARATSSTENKYAAAVRDLENGRREILQLTRENEELCVQLDNTGAECDVLAKELSDVRALRIKEKKEHEDILADIMKAKHVLAKELTDIRALRTKEKKEHEDILADIMKAKQVDKTSANKHLLSENQRLRAENERLNAVAATQAATSSSSSPQSSNITPLTPQKTISPISPLSIFKNNTPPSSQHNRAPWSPLAPSSMSHPPTTTTTTAPSTSTNESQKDDNIRTIYTKTKRRFDNLQSVTMQLLHCTRGMDLALLGEFGKLVTKLRDVLNEDGKDRANEGGIK
ncbi:hypothetical protein GMOD_00000657 [Pyrenophora seminiperda CCB06]|uniref:Uncharacterized protein n=1 Tax=Pyrenophora seminiperda CCB06 TaxID=1302712 RepID=A0A3M7M7R0_9PLEO|nr:hypothetical protein GMOD_00000657 [Pyrenophora seminiperda CCB06]